MVDFIKQKVADFFRKEASCISVSSFFHGSATVDKKVLFFVSDKKTPLCIVKAVRDSKYNKKLGNERDGQLHMGKILTSFQTPRVLFDSYFEDKMLYAEEVADGIPIGAHQASHYLKEVFVYQKEIPRKDALSLEKLVSIFSKNSIDDDLFQANFGQLQTRSGSVYQSLSHGDLTYMNITTGRKGLYLIDWERYNERPIWGIDFVHYFIRCHSPQDQNVFRKALREVDFVSKQEKQYFENVYLVDSLFDMLQKQDKKAYERVVTYLQQQHA